MREVARDLQAAEGAGRFVPGADPVDGSGHGEGGEFGVARGDGSVGDSLFDVAADGGVDAALEGTDLFAGLGGEFIFVEHGDAAAEIVKDDGLCVGFDVGLDLAEAGAATDKGLVEKSFDQCDACAVTLDQDLFFVVKVIVESGLGNARFIDDMLNGSGGVPGPGKTFESSLKNKPARFRMIDGF